MWYKSFSSALIPRPIPRTGAAERGGTWKLGLRVLGRAPREIARDAPVPTQGRDSPPSSPARGGRFTKALHGTRIAIVPDLTTPAATLMTG